MRQSIKCFELFDFYEAEASRLIEAELPLPAYEQVIKSIALLLTC